MAKTCIKEGEGTWDDFNYKQTICTGDSSCEGELAWCKKEERKGEKCPREGSSDGFTHCSPSLGGKKRGNGIPGQCIDESKANDEKVDAMEDLLVICF